MLKAPSHQVAGHSAHEGQLGPLVDDCGRFYKPLQHNSRGSRELAFYNSFSSDPRIPTHIRRFFPAFYGTQIVEASDGSGLHPHLILEDLLDGLKHPSVIDVKIGTRTWYPQASEDYIQKNTKRDMESTTVWLGFRISGLQIHDSMESVFWKPTRKHVQSFTPEDVRVVLRKFASTNPTSNLEPDCSLASAVFGGSDGILAQLLELKAWFEDQTYYHFYSVSVLMICEKDASKPGGVVSKLKLIDFAHVVEAEGVIDFNFLGGLCSLIKFISEILTGPGNHVVDGH